MNLNKDINKIREDFYGINDYVWLYAAGSGPPFKPVREAAEAWWSTYVRLEREPSPISAFSESSILINAQNHEICMISRVSEGLNILKDIIKWDKGDNIVVTDISYPSSVHVFMNLRKKDVEIKRIKNINGDINIEDWEKEINEKTKLVVVNRTEPFCGLTHDLTAISKIAHDNGAFIVDDDFQALGVIPINVKKTNIDFLVSGSFKWQNGPRDAGIFYIKEELIEQFIPYYSAYENVVRPGESEMAGYRYIEEPDHDNLESYEYPYISTAQRFNRGYVYTPGHRTHYEWAAALKYINDLERNYGSDSIAKRVRELGGYLIDKLIDIGCKVYTPLEPKKRHGLIVYTTGSHKLDEKSYREFYFNKPHIRTSIRYVGGIGGIRVCTHYYNTEEEIDLLINKQKKVLS